MSEKLGPSPPAAPATDGDSQKVEWVVKVNPDGGTSITPVDSDGNVLSPDLPDDDYTNH